MTMIDAIDNHVAPIKYDIPDHVPLLQVNAAIYAAGLPEHGAARADMRATVLAKISDIVRKTAVHEKCIDGIVHIYCCSYLVERPEMQRLLDDAWLSGYRRAKAEHEMREAMAKAEHEMREAMAIAAHIFEQGRI